MRKLTIKDNDVFIELDGIITAIVGPTNSGKTVILKKLCNRIENKDVKIDDVPIDEYDINFLRNNIVVCLDDNEYKQEYVAEELFHNLNLLGYRIDEITSKIEEITKIFKIEKLMSERIDSLYLEDKILVKILSFLIVDPKIIAIDDLFSYLDPKKLEILFDYIRKKNISMIYVTTNPEHLLLADDIVLMNNYKAIICSDRRQFFSGNSVLPYMGLGLPFIIEMSHNLELYGLVDKTYESIEKVVDHIWK
ncbi:MAG: ATP-binding cassette domain-containing protein [Bacilli bacterium]|nr:ATP-binding cassette domain-containing protein [Bacilli bacterium]